MKYLIIFAIALLCVNAVRVERQGGLHPHRDNLVKPE